MKISFIIPSWSYWLEPTRAQPLTQMYLATIIKKYTNYVTNFIDLRDGPKDIKEANLFLYTVASPDMKEVTEIVKDIRNKFPNTKHIAGGPHPSLFPEECSKVFDTVVIGPGENAIIELINDYKLGELKQKYNIPIEPEQEFPFTKRNYLPKDKIITSLFKTEDIPSTTVLFSHGCPFNCTFCANYNKGSIKRRSNKSIAAEIRYLIKKYDIKGLSLQDEICIPLNYKDAEKWTNNIKQFNIKWRGQIRAGVDKEILKLAKESGCIELSIGLESVNQEVLNKANKGILVEQAEKTLKDCKEVGIKTRLYLLNGLPGEGRDVVEETILFIERTNPDVVLLSTLQPYPGSDIATNPDKYDIDWISKDYENFNHLRCRFDDSNDRLEDVVPFGYKNGLTRDQILNNLLKLQSYLKGRDMNK